jgi:hypothetical protein
MAPSIERSFGVSVTVAPKARMVSTRSLVASSGITNSIGTLNKLAIMAKAIPVFPLVASFYHAKSGTVFYAAAGVVTL